VSVDVLVVVYFCVVDFVKFVFVIENVYVVIN